MSQAVADAVVPVLQAIPAAVARGVAASQLSCGPCVLRKARFHREHGDEISFALARAREAAGDSEIPDVAAFLPDRLKPDPSNPIDDGRLPWQHAATTMIDGTLYCDWDAVALETRITAQPAPQQPAQPGPPRKPFFIANSSDVGQVLRDSERVMGAPGVPGQ
jgi:hypothetical protein